MIALLSLNLWQWFGQPDPYYTPIEYNNDPIEQCYYYDYHHDSYINLGGWLFHGELTRGMDIDYVSLYRTDNKCYIEIHLVEEANVSYDDIGALITNGVNTTYFMGDENHEFRITTDLFRHELSPTLYNNFLHGFTMVISSWYRFGGEDGRDNVEAVHDWLYASPSNRINTSYEPPLFEWMYPIETPPPEPNCNAVCLYCQHPFNGTHCPECGQPGYY